MMVAVLTLLRAEMPRLESNINGMKARVSGPIPGANLVRFAAISSAKKQLGFQIRNGYQGHGEHASLVQR